MRWELSATPLVFLRLIFKSSAEAKRCGLHTGHEITPSAALPDLPQNFLQTNPVIALRHNARHIRRHRISRHHRIRPQRIPQKKHPARQQHHPVCRLPAPRLADECLKILRVNRLQIPLRKPLQPRRSIRQQLLPSPHSDKPNIKLRFPRPRPRRMAFILKQPRWQSREHPRHGQMNHRPARHIQRYNPTHRKFLNRHGSPALSTSPAAPNAPPNWQTPRKRTPAATDKTGPSLAERIPPAAA